MWAYSSGVTHEPPLQHKKKSLSATEHLPHKYMCLEPPLQRKKKPVQPHGSKSVGLSESGEEYVLLGSQKKFAPNVVYKAKVGCLMSLRQVLIGFVPVASYLMFGMIFICSQ